MIIIIIIIVIVIVIITVVVVIIMLQWQACTTAVSYTRGELYGKPATGGDHLGHLSRRYHYYCFIKVCPSSH